MGPVKSNKVVYSELMFSVQDEICFTIIDNERHKYLPDGDSQISWLKLNEKFQSISNNMLCHFKG